MHKTIIIPPANPIGSSSQTNIILRCLYLAKAMENDMIYPGRISRQLRRTAGLFEYLYTVLHQTNQGNQGPLKSFALENDLCLQILKMHVGKCSEHRLYGLWFQRIWVIQEYSLPPEIRMICGMWEISGTILAIVLTLPVWWYSRQTLDGLTADAPIESGGVWAGLQKLQLCHGLDDLRELDDHGTGSHLSLMYLLHNCRMCKATDPRDLFFWGGGGL